MPNYVKNVIKVTKNQEEFKKAVLDENGQFDFNRIIPMPKDLTITSGSGSYEPNIQEKSWKASSEQVKYQKEMEMYFQENLTQAEFVDTMFHKVVAPRGESYSEYQLEAVITMFKGFYNYKKYGYVDWYKFSVANWGTKWNACESEVYKANGNLCIEFDTAWSTPMGIWVELAQEFDFTVAFADEDLGSNLGILVAKDGFIDDLDIFENWSLDARQVVALKIRGYEGYSLSEICEDYEIKISDEDFENVEKTLQEYI